jgi:hypothetical protein
MSTLIDTEWRPNFEICLLLAPLWKRNEKIRRVEIRYPAARVALQLTSLQNVGHEWQ